MTLPSQARRHTGVSALAVSLVAVLALLGPGGTTPANASISCPDSNNVTILSDGWLSGVVVASPVSYRDGTRPVMLSYSQDHDAMRWCMKLKRPLHYEIRNMYSGKCLTVPVPAQNGTPVDLRTCTGYYNQAWMKEKVGAPPRTTYTLRNVGTGRCLDIIDKNPNPGALLQVWSCSYAWNQTWWAGFKPIRN